jgi:hypothetical protein
MIKWRFLVALIIVAPAILLLQRQVNVLKGNYLEEQERPFVPPEPEFVRVATLGYQNLVADMYWLRTIQYRENCYDRGKFPKDLYLMTEFLTDLDPHYCLAYFYSGLALIDGHGEQKEIVSLLSKGCLEDNCPGYWKNPFLLSYYYAFELQDFEHATPYMKQACKWHQGHKLYCGLASRLESVSGAPELGIEMLREAMALNQDPDSLNYFQEKLAEPNTKIIERDLTAAAQRYTERRGSPPARLEDLFLEGPVMGQPPAGYQARPYSQVPPHPLAGHTFIYDPDRNVVRSDPPVNLAPKFNPRTKH